MDWDAEHRIRVGASEAGHCAREISYRLTGTPKKALSEKQEAIFARGHALEPVIADMLRGRCWQVWIPDPEKYTIGGWLTGRPDRFVEVPGEAGRQNCQIKAVNPTSFGFLRGGLRDNGEQYWWQVQAEMAATSLQRTKFVACAVDRMELYIEDVPFEPEAWTERAAILQKTVRDACDRGVLAPPDYQLPAWQCSYCWYVETCQPLQPQTYVASGKELVVADGAHPITAVKAQYIEMMGRKDAIEAELAEMKGELDAFADESGAQKIMFYGLTGSFVQGRETIDTKKLREIAPDLAAQVTKKGQPYRAWKRALGA